MENPSIALVMSSETRMKEIQKISQKWFDAVLSAIWAGNFKADENLQHLVIETNDISTYNLIHCAAGISRSFDIVRTLFDFSNIYINQYREIQSIQIFIDNSLQDKMHKIKPQKVLRRIKQTRPYENPNKGFTKQLEKSNQEVMEQKQ